MKIALFGGAFDPPHIGHKVVADSLIRNGVVDEVWFVPVFQHPWADRYGKQQLTAYDKRVKMLQITTDSDFSQEIQLSNESGINKLSSRQVNQKVSNREKVVHFKQVSFTYDTLKYFSRKFPEHDFSWVMGSEYLDRFDDFLTGHPKLLEYTFYVYPRAGYTLDNRLKKKNMILLHEMPEVTVSSTEIKRRRKLSEDFSNLVLAQVHDFIQKEELYTQASFGSET